MTDLNDIEREIDALGIRNEVDQAMAEYKELQRPVLVPGLGIVSALAAQMLSDADRPPWLRFGSAPFGGCYMLGNSAVHVKPGCHCPPKTR